LERRLATGLNARHSRFPLRHGSNDEQVLSLVDKSQIDALHDVCPPLDSVPSDGSLMFRSPGLLVLEAFVTTRIR